MKKRIFGLETEFGFTLTSQGRCDLPLSRVVLYLFAQFNTAADFWNVFLENGVCFYLDTGNHPEYATPERSSPKDVVIYYKADEPLLETYIQYAQSVTCSISGSSVRTPFSTRTTRSRT